MIWIGTSGFQYPEWRGTFYPEKFPPAKMLSFYATQFSTSEINYSFYRIPAIQTLEKWAAETPESFHFTFKAPRKITHDLQLKNAAEILQRFCDTLQMIEMKLGAVLFQLPPSIKKDVDTLQAFLQLLPRHLKCAFEFRNATWFDDDVFACLQEGKAALCIAESEKLSTPVVFPASFGYFRLRNEAYTAKDIVRWAEIIRAQKERLEDIYVYFKHEETGTGPKFAKQLMEQLQRI